MTILSSIEYSIHILTILSLYLPYSINDMTLILRILFHIIQCYYSKYCIKSFFSPSVLNSGTKLIIFISLNPSDTCGL